MSCPGAKITEHLQASSSTTAIRYPLDTRSAKWHVDCRAAANADGEQQWGCRMTVHYDRILISSKREKVKSHAGHVASL